jgi:hypothetical protein
MDLQTSSLSEVDFSQKSNVVRASATFIIAERADWRTPEQGFVRTERP